MNGIMPNHPLAANFVAEPSAKPPLRVKDGDQEVRKAFEAFVGQTFYGQMLHAMRKTLGKPAYFYGGRAEEIFQQQLDQVVGEKLSEASGQTLSGPMFELYQLQRA